MTTDEMKRLLHGSPFVPFTIFLAGGENHKVDHPDFATLSRGGRILAISLEDEEAFALVDVMLATHIVTHPISSPISS